MTAATVSRYVSGHCGVGRHAFCRGEYAGTLCRCECQHEPEAAGVNGTEAVLAPAEDPKDALQDGSLSLSGAPAPAAPPNLLLLAAVVDDLSAAVAGWVDTAAEIEALDALGLVRLQRQCLAQVEATLERRAARVMQGDIVEWPGGVAERRFGKGRKEWQHDELVRQVVNLIAADVATDKTSGELDDMLAALVQDACSRFAETHRPDWRVTVLKHMGVDPDDYYTSIPGRVTVAITQARPA